MQNALQENEAQAQRAEGGAANTELKPGVTINLSHKGIRELPEEVVDVIKNELERYERSIVEMEYSSFRFVFFVFSVSSICLDYLDSLANALFLLQTCVVS